MKIIKDFIKNYMDARERANAPYKTYKKLATLKELWDNNFEIRHLLEKPETYIFGIQEVEKDIGDKVFTIRLKSKNENYQLDFITAIDGCEECEFEYLSKVNIYSIKNNDRILISPENTKVFFETLNVKETVNKTINDLKKLKAERENELLKKLKM